MWQRSHKSSEERKLELRLGPPGEESLNESMKNGNIKRDESSLSLGYFSTQKISTSDKPGSGGTILPSVWPSTSYHHHNQHQAKAKPSSFLQLPSSSQNMIVMGKDVSEPCCVDLKIAEKKAFSPFSPNPAVSNRTASASVVGWPPIRSFRKNLTSGSPSKLPSGSQQHQHQQFVPDKVAIASERPTENFGKGLFVKINMDGVPIGRKVDINAYDSYENLSSAVDKLFRGLLAEMNLSHIICSARRDSSAGGIQNKQEEEKANKGLLVGSGEYTLVYEDNEGDRMLVGDVPWHMFVSTVKRLRVLKSSNLPAFTRELESLT